MPISMVMPKSHEGPDDRFLHEIEEHRLRKNGKKHIHIIAKVDIE